MIDRKCGYEASSFVVALLQRTFPAPYRRSLNDGEDEEPFGGLQGARGA